MRSIWKFPLATTDTQTLDVPEGAKPLTVQAQGVTPCLWAEVNPNGQTERRYIHTFGTGHPIPDDFQGEYLGSYQLLDGGLVFHVYLT